MYSTIKQHNGDDKCTRCQRMNVPCVKQGRGRTCKQCAEAHASCERGELAVFLHANFAISYILVNNSAIASIRQDLLEMHKKYEEAMEAINKNSQYTMYMASHSLKAVESCSSMKKQLDEFVSSSVKNHLSIDDRVRMVEAFVKAHAQDPSQVCPRIVM